MRLAIAVVLLTGGGFTTKMGGGTTLGTHGRDGGEVHAIVGLDPLQVGAAAWGGELTRIVGADDPVAFGVSAFARVSLLAPILAFIRTGSSNSLWVDRKETLMSTCSAGSMWAASSGLAAAPRA